MTESEWQLDLTAYQAFLEVATGISVGADLSADDCYRIGNRLEALIEERRREGRWTADVAAAYPDVRTREDIVWLARFFRRCHECRLPEGVC